MLWPLPGITAPAYCIITAPDLISTFRHTTLCVHFCHVDRLQGCCIYYLSKRGVQSFYWLLLLYICCIQRQCSFVFLENSYSKVISRKCVKQYVPDLGCQCWNKLLFYLFIYLKHKVILHICKEFCNTHACVCMSPSKTCYAPRCSQSQPVYFTWFFFIFFF